MAPAQSPQRASTTVGTYIPAIDGLRAVAITAVVLFHLNLSQVPGGFLGVDVFFVISGFVITRVLLGVVVDHGLDLRAFAMARLRRLAPALLSLVFVFGFVAGIWQREVVGRFAQDVPAALFGVENWALVLRNADYFTAMGRPSLLQHAWSLAIETQFYVLWPLVLLVAFRRGGKRAVQRAALTGALMSTLTLLLLVASGASVARIYYGSDTHSVGILLGCALAVHWGPERLGGVMHARGRAVIDAVGALALFVLVLLFLLVQGEASPRFHWSLLGAAVMTTALLAVLVHPESRLARAFSVAPLRWLGTRSYGIYLWHWPVFQIMRPGLDLQGDRALINLMSLAIVLLIAELSYRLVELPVRSGALTQRLRQWRTAPKRVLIARFSAATVIATAWFGALAGLDIDTGVDGSRAPASSPVSQVQSLDNANSAAASPQASPAATPTETPALAAVRRFDVFGDSVLLGAQSTLGKALELGAFDAEVGRQADVLLDVVQAAKVGATDGVIINLGNNGYVERTDLRELLRTLRDQPRVILINTAVDRIWREHNNKVVRDLTAAFPNVRLADWETRASGHPEYFVSDGVHLSRSGVAQYTDLIVKAALLP